MKNSHTPGPWKVERDPAFAPGLHPYHEARYVTNGCATLGDDFTEDPQAKIICALRDSEEQAANARLIAAAPELLKALEDAASTLEFILPPARTLANAMKFGGTSYDALYAARAALAKAKGQP